MAEKYLREFNGPGVTFKGASYPFMSRINSSFDELNVWTTPQIDHNLFAYTIMTKREWTAEFETYVEDAGNFGVLVSSLSDEEQKEIRKNAEEAENAFGTTITTMLFGKDLIPFAYRIGSTGRWMYFMGSTNNWEDLTYNSLAKIVNDAKGKPDSIKFIWKIGDVIFSDSSASMLAAISAIVTDQYCDKYIPNNAERHALAKVTKEGFSFITYFLCKYLKQTATKYNVITQYERLDKIHAIPFIPTNWQPDLETIKSIKLQAIGEKLWDAPEETVETGEDKIMKAMQEIKDKIEDSLTGENSTQNWLTLSEILDVRFNVSLAHELWNDEYMIEINEGVSCKNVQIDEDKILLGVFSWGVLELLIEDNVLSDEDLDKLELEMEMDHGIPVSILSFSSDKGQKLLESVTNDAEKS